MRVTAIIPAAGHGSRLGSKVPKPFIPLGGRPLFFRTLLTLRAAYPFDEIILAVDRLRIPEVRRVLDRMKIKKVLVVPGGKTRAESVKNALLAVKKETQWVLVHDAARPFVTSGLVRRVVDAAVPTGAAIAAVPACATVKRVRPGGAFILKTEDRSVLFLAQTPQVFKKALLVERYRALGPRALERTDEAALFDGTKIQVRIVPGEARNIKITTQEDLKMAQFYLEKTC